MDKIQGSHKLEWLYVLFPVRIYFTSSKKVTDYLQVKGIECVFKHKNILWMKTNHYPNKITFHLVTVVPMSSFTLKSSSKLRFFCTLGIRQSSHVSFLTLIRLNYDNGFHNTLHYNLPLYLQRLLTVHSDCQCSHYALMGICGIIVTMKIKDLYNI